MREYVVFRRVSVGILNEENNFVEGMSINNLVREEEFCCFLNNIK